MKYAGDGIPDLVIVNRAGKILADSYVRGTYVGPAQVLTELDKLLGGAGKRSGDALNSVAKLNTTVSVKRLLVAVCR